MVHELDGMIISIIIIRSFGKSTTIYWFSLRFLEGMIADGGWYTLTLLT